MVSHEFLADGKAYPAGLEIEERPDVQQAIPDVTKRTDIGFRLTVEDAEALWANHETAALYLSDGQTRVKALEDHG